VVVPSLVVMYAISKANLLADIIDHTIIIVDFFQQMILEGTYPI
jgi:hypothetical protein